MHFIELPCSGLNGCNDWWIHDCTFEDLGIGCPAKESYIAIKPQNASGLIVEKNIFRNIGGYIMRYVDGFGIKFINNYVEIETAGIKAWGANLDSLRITDNIFMGDGNGAWNDSTGSCIVSVAVNLSNNAQNAIIFNNSFYDCVTSIDIGSSEDFGSRDNRGHLIEGNRIYRTEKTCNAYNSPIVISDVSLPSTITPYHNIEVSDIIIRNNVIHYYGNPISFNQGAAIDITSAHTHAFTSNITIHNNTIRGFRFGVRFEERLSKNGIPLPFQTNNVDIKNNIFSKIRNGFYVLIHIVFKLPKSSFVFLNLNKNGLLFVAPFILLLSKLAGKKIAVRLFGGKGVYSNLGYFGNFIKSLVFKQVEFLFVETKEQVQQLVGDRSNVYWLSLIHI